MTNFVNADDFEKSLESVYVYDRLTGAGFCLTKDIVLVDLSKLSQDERLIVTAPTTLMEDTQEVTKIIDKYAQTLISQLKLSTDILGYVLMQIYQSQPQHLQDQMLSTVKTALNQINRNS